MSCETCGRHLLAVEWCLPCDGKPIRNADAKIRELEVELERWKNCDLAKAMEAQKSELLYFKSAFDDDHYPTDLHEWLNPVQAATLRAERDRYRRALENILIDCRVHYEEGIRQSAEDALRGE